MINLPTKAPHTKIYLFLIIMICFSRKKKYKFRPIFFCWTVGGCCYWEEIVENYTGKLISGPITWSECCYLKRFYEGCEYFLIWNCKILLQELSCLNYRLLIIKIGAIMWHFWAVWWLSSLILVWVLVGVRSP